MAPMDGLDDVRLVFADDPSRKWGFIIYRCTYGDDAAWEKFMAHMNKRVLLNLEDEGNGALFDRLDWDVQEDPSLDGVGESEVRKRFLAWTSAHESEEFWLGTPPFHACILVDKHALHSVLEGPPAEQFDAYGEGSLILVSRDEDEDMTFVGASVVVPHVYTLLEIGWDSFAKDPDEGEVAECIGMEAFGEPEGFFRGRG